jgi:pectin methylesterase-like acyl-CoA thioesterase
MGAGYVRLQNEAGVTRTTMQITPATLNQAVIDLHRGTSVRDVARGLLQFIVLLAEGSRFRNQAAATATAFGNGWAYTPSETHVAQHNSWLELSQQLFDWLAVNWGANGGANYPAAVVGILMMVHHSGRNSYHDRELYETSTRYVAPDGFADHTTVQAAINAVPNTGAPTTIFIDKGVYNEVISVPKGKSWLTIASLSGTRSDVVIYNTRCHGMINPATGLKYGTQGSAVATFSSTDLTVLNLTIQNTFDRAAHPEISPYETQAVAVAAMGDRQVFRNVAIMSHQDTLLVKGETPTTQARQYFVDCFIRGDVDFIFGNATAVIDRSLIQMLPWLGGTLLAPNTDYRKKYGILITDSEIITNGVPEKTLYLGRPWHNAPEVWPQAVVRGSVLHTGVNMEHPWTDMTPDYPWSSARFSEYANSGGPLSQATGSSLNAPHLSPLEAGEYTAQKYLAGTDGWNPVR